MRWERAVKLVFIVCLIISSLSTTRVKEFENSKTLVDNFDTEAPSA
ncbi:hypothetical protein [uncultured Thomasclavelia sp.]|uniref:Uncharacterized protein n=1 Tax=Thomasclavelia ramosa DSM 1402 TaxID=445974 RepID=B0N307_9FIRM|nr:hypothetical protein [uncultured Thomasclavelia sp.]EDS18829.1 hypothetical protein CLORAM_00824 [Thomasclavelia ramosa DSM 1402]MCB5518534.1 hypothetical protein [Thomasclavelia ramosa]